jgi:hypothetical protein
VIENERDEDAPAVPEPAEPEEPQTSVHEQPVQPDGEDDARRTASGRRGRGRLASHGLLGRGRQRSSSSSFS